MISYKSLPDILIELKKLCVQAVTGTLFIVSDQNHSASFFINKGIIVTIQCRGRFGIKAIEQIGRIESGSYRFESGLGVVRAMSLPDTEELIRQILSYASGVNGGGSSETAFLNQQRKAAVESLLIDAFGPMGSLLMDSLADARSANEVLSVLKKELGSSDLGAATESKLLSILGE